MSAWISQDGKQVEKHGNDNVSWYANWRDNEGKQRSKSFGRGARGKRNAEKMCRRIEGELAAGTYQSTLRKSWKEFREEYEERVVAGMELGTQDATLSAMNNFERIIKPKRMSAITSRTIAAFIAGRRKDRGKLPGSKVVKATINRDLRHLKAVLRKAKKWKFVAEVPDIEFLKEIKRLPRFVAPAQFKQIFDSVQAARRPQDLPNITLEAWWKGLFITAYMTGWRIGEILALRWEDVDLEAGTAITRGDVNKGRRDALIALHPLVIQHVQDVQSADTHVFPWNHARRALYVEYHLIQDAAKLDSVQGYFGFHDLRRGFATMNADRMSADALQSLMRHAAYQTTQGYINMARQLKPAVENLFVPDIASGGGQ